MCIPTTKCGFKPTKNCGFKGGNVNSRIKLRTSAKNVDSYQLHTKLEFSHQKMADFKRRGFQATKTVGQKLATLAYTSMFKQTQMYSLPKIPLKIMKIPLNSHGKKHHFPAFQHQNQRSPPPKNRGSATSPVEHLVAPVRGARCTTLSRLRPKPSFVGF